MLEPFEHPRHGANLERTCRMNDMLLAEPMLEDFTPQAKTGWKYFFRGHHFVVNSRFGQLEYGMVPDAGYDQWLFHENGGGGSLTIGYTRKRRWFRQDDIQIVMLRADRFNLVGEFGDFELPGGFTEDGETKIMTAIRETLEETDQLVHPNYVAGRNFVGNRAFFKLDSEREGTSVLAYELTKEQVKAVNASDKVFLCSWQGAIRMTRDALTGMAIARLIASLR
jgi:hypothetical protein